METKEILKQLRKEKGYSAKEVADGCSMSIGVYKKYESGERGVGTPALCKIADFYGVSTDYLLGRTPVKQMVTEEPDPVNLLNLNPLEKSIVYAYIALSPEKRTEFVETMKQIANGADVQLTINKPEIQQQPAKQQQLPEPPTVQPIVQSRPQQPIQQMPQIRPQAPVQPQQVERPWIMAARSADGKFVRQVLTQEEVDKLLESLEDAPESGY